MTEPHGLDSTLAGRAAASRLLDGIVVVDVDVHIHETPAALAPHCEMPWRKSLETIAELPQTYMGLPGFSSYIYGWPLFPGGGGRRMTTSTPAEMRRDLDDLGIDIGVLFPDQLLLHAVLQDVDYASAVARAYNRWLVEEWLSDDNGLVGAILAPHQDPVAGAAELRAYASHKNVVAVYLPTACVEPLYGHRRYDPLYDAAQETGLPVFLHSVTAVHPAFPFNLHGFQTVFAAHALGHAFSIVANLVSMIETGVPVRFPGLQIAFTEAGIAWVPWIMLRLDKEYMERRREVPFLVEPPSAYIKRMFFATQPIEEPERMKDMATLLSLFEGENSVMFASDWPHHDFDHPAKVLQIPISDEARRKILGGNAIRLLQLGASRP